MNRSKEVDTLVDRLRDLISADPKLGISNTATAVEPGVMFVVSHGDILKGGEDVQYFDVIVLPRPRG